jgi:hypothetical protein
MFIHYGSGLLFGSLKRHLITKKAILHVKVFLAEVEDFEVDFDVGLGECAGDFLFGFL